MDLISIIVPVYKVEMYLDRCVRSLVEQSYTNLEIILVDDGSPDNCGIMCDRWTEKDRRIKVIHKKNGGLSDARNAGLRIAAGEYIAFVDSDDWIEPEMYGHMLGLMGKYDA
ncbi:MAG: glycosyltransferase, partial [Lachnospiraceae bacterium]|nr:glycosyltransferase [Lachnospiraceae bacterium]